MATSTLTRVLQPHPPSLAVPAIQARSFLWAALLIPPILLLGATLALAWYYLTTVYGLTPAQIFGFEAVSIGV